MSILMTFSSDELKSLHFSFVDVLMMVSQIEGETGMDEKEHQAFLDLLNDSRVFEDALAREAFELLAQRWDRVFAAYQQQYEYSPEYFERSLVRSRIILDKKLSPNTSRKFKRAYLQLAVKIAEASAENSTAEPIGPLEQKTIDSITKILAIGER
jgi:uncharacterized protein (UPF0332 family)